MRSLEELEAAVSRWREGPVDFNFPSELQRLLLCECMLLLVQELRRDATPTLAVATDRRPSKARSPDLGEVCPDCHGHSTTWEGERCSTCDNTGVQTPPR